MLSEVNFRESEKSEIVMTTDRLAGFPALCANSQKFSLALALLVVETCGALKCALNLPFSLGANLLAWLT